MDKLIRVLAMFAGVLDKLIWVLAKFDGVLDKFSWVWVKYDGVLVKVIRVLANLVGDLGKLREGNVLTNIWAVCATD